MTYIFDKSFHLNKEQLEDLRNMNKKNHFTRELIEVETNEDISSKKKLTFFNVVDVVLIPNRYILDRKSIWYTKYEFNLFRQHFIRDIQKLIQDNTAENVKEAKNKLCDPNFEENPIEILFEMTKLLRDENLVDSSPRIFCEDGDY